jgi:hypothetical protein
MADHGLRKDVRWRHPDTKALLPERCGARNPVTNDPILIVRDELGYRPWSETLSPEDWNRLHDIDERTASIMVALSMADAGRDGELVGGRRFRF